MKDNIILDDDELVYIEKARQSSKFAIPTDVNVAIKMLDLLPDGIWNPNAKFLDPFCKTGAFLRAVKNKLYYSPIMNNAFPDRVDRIMHIENTQLFGLSPTEECKECSSYVLYSKPYDLGIYTVTDLVDVIKDREKFRKLIKEKFKDMQFDVILGNPPYNNDLYISFILNLRGLEKKYMLFITPAKWQAKGGKLNDQFREKIVPYMSDVVFYPDAFELFNIREQEGITYYTIDKQLHKDKRITVTCKANAAYNSNETRDDLLNTLYGSNISSIIYKVKSASQLDKIIGTKQSEYVSNTESGYKQGKYPLYIGNKTNSYVDDEDLKTKVGLDKYKVTTSVMPVDVGFDKNGQMFGLSKTYIVPPNAVPKGSFPVLMKFNTLQESESFQSYCNCKLIRFLYLIGICGKTIAEEFWRYIPSQNKWDHIFTDDELYKKYNLTIDEIKVVNSVIKDR